MSKIIVVGSINIDLVVQVDRLPLLGETVQGGGYAEHFGGKGANQAVAAARMGSDVWMIGCVGNDAFGHAMVENLGSCGIHTEGIRIADGVSSGKAIIMVENGDNAIIVDGGANMELSPEDIERNEHMIKESDCILLQLEVPAETVLAAAKLAKKHGVTVLLNPAPAKEFPDELLGLVDYFVPNETECGFYTGVTIDSVESARNAICILQNRGIPNVVITMGSEGAVYSEGNSIHHQNGRTVNAVDSTAAGDSFIGTLATFLGNGRSIHDAVRWGNAVGSIVVTKHGAQDSIPTLDEVRQYLS